MNSIVTCTCNWYYSHLQHTKLLGTTIYKSNKARGYEENAVDAILTIWLFLFSFLMGDEVQEEAESSFPKLKKFIYTTRDHSNLV